MYFFREREPMAVREPLPALNYSYGCPPPPSYVRGTECCSREYFEEEFDMLVNGPFAYVEFPTLIGTP